MLDTRQRHHLRENGEVTGVRLTTEENEPSPWQPKGLSPPAASAPTAVCGEILSGSGRLVTTNHKGATGGGIALLERIGAGTVDMGETKFTQPLSRTSRT